MKACEIIRNLLDVIDDIECQLTQNNTPKPLPDELGSLATIPVDKNHFKQIFDIISAEKSQVYDNSPAEVVTSIGSVTVDAGGGWNGPKNPSDLRGVSVSMYPGYQANQGRY
jgi:hypothetical protein